MTKVKHPSFLPPPPYPPLRAAHHTELQGFWELELQKHIYIWHLNFSNSLIRGYEELTSDIGWGGEGRGDTWVMKEQEVCRWWGPQKEKNIGVRKYYVPLSCSYPIPIGWWVSQWHKLPPPSLRPPTNPSNSSHLFPGLTREAWLLGTAQGVTMLFIITALLCCGEYKGVG